MEKNHEGKIVQYFSYTLLKTTSLKIFSGKPNGTKPRQRKRVQCVLSPPHINISIKVFKSTHANLVYEFCKVVKDNALVNKSARFSLERVW